MARRRNRHQAQDAAARLAARAWAAKRSAPEGPAAMGTGLAVVDAAAAKARWAREHAELLGEIEAYRARFGEFEATGERLYRDWLHVSFPREMSAVRALSEEFEEIRRLALAVEYEAEWLGVSRAKAYRAVMGRHRRAEPLISSEAREAERRAEEREAAAAEAARASTQDLNEREREELRAEMREFLVQNFGARAYSVPDAALDAAAEKFLAGEAFVDAEMLERLEGRRANRRARAAETEGPGPDRREASGAEGREDSAAEPEVTPEYLAHYRFLVKRLHPDRIGSPTAAQKRLWDELQRAHARRDLGRLIALRALVDEPGRDPGEGVPETVGAFLARVIREVFGLRATLRGLRTEEGRLGQEPAYRYFRRRDDEAGLSKLKARTEAALRADVATLRESVRDAREILEQLARSGRGDGRR